MNSNSLAKLTDEELRRSFHKHTFRGLYISLALLGLFFIIYLVPIDVRPAVASTAIIVIALVSVVLAVWYHLGRRRYYKEFRRRNLMIRG